MTNRVHPAVHNPKPTSRAPATDRMTAQSTAEKLLLGHQSLLRVGDAGHSQVDRGFGIDGAVNQAFSRRHNSTVEPLRRSSVVWSAHNGTCATVASATESSVEL